jgi:hypothetical protein
MEDLREEEDTAIAPALHLRVFAAILAGQAEKTLVEQALTLAQEVYELEFDASLDDSRSW